MPNVTSVTTQVNNTPSLYEPNLNEIGRRRAYSGEFRRFQQAERLCNEKGASPTIRSLLSELIKSSNSLCEVFTGQSSFAQKLHVSISTIKRAYKTITEWGWIKSERRGNSWAEKQTNKITLLFLQTELPPVSVKMNHDINNLIPTYPKQRSYKQTYDVCEDASPKKEKKVRKGTHINASALNGEDPDGEVIRVCLAWLLCEKKTKYAVLKMRDRKKMGNPVKYLARMCAGLDNGSWEMEKEEAPRLPIEQRRAIENELRQRAEEMAFASLAQKGFVQPTVYDPFSPWHAHYSTETSVIFNQLCKEHGALNNAN